MSFSGKCVCFDLNKCVNNPLAKVSFSWQKCHFWLWQMCLGLVIHNQIFPYQRQENWYIWIPVARPQLSEYHYHIMESFWLKTATPHRHNIFSWCVQSLSENWGWLKETFHMQLLTNTYLLLGTSPANGRDGRIFWNKMFMVHNTL